MATLCNCTNFAMFKLPVECPEAPGLVECPEDPGLPGLMMIQQQLYPSLVPSCLTCYKNKYYYAFFSSQNFATMKQTMTKATAKHQTFGVVKILDAT